MDSTGKQGMGNGTGVETGTGTYCRTLLSCYNATCLHDEQSDFLVEAGLSS